MLPDFNGIIECYENECLFLYGWEEYKGKKYRAFYGVGYVVKINQGEKIDYVRVNFSLMGKHGSRTIRVVDNLARRQIQTLKRGQMCHVVGFASFYVRKKNKDNKSPRDRLDLCLWARGLQGWYVPTMLEIKKAPKNDNVEQFGNQENRYYEQDQNQVQDILDLFKGMSKYDDENE